MAHGTQPAEDVHPSASLKTKPMDIACWKSEGPIRAMMSGNADGAKGSWFRIADHRHKDRTPGRENS